MPNGLFMGAQGDVFIAELSEREVKRIMHAPKEVKRENGKVVLAHGEITGHSHAISEKGATLYDTALGMVLKVVGEVVVRHEEHDPIILKQGYYRIIRQREYRPEEIRDVQD